MTGGNSQNSQNGDASNSGNESDTANKSHAADAKKNGPKPCSMVS